MSHTFLGYALNDIELPASVSTFAPNRSTFYAGDRLLLVVNGISTGLSSTLSQISGTARLHIKLASGRWVTDIPVSASVSGLSLVQGIGAIDLGSMGIGSIPLSSAVTSGTTTQLMFSLEILRDTLLVSPRIPAMVY